ncbi:hypothetical protein AQJ64_13100 [Streptomyces griseoruber]|uniref:Uncharacterized protein n=1 Tax=Streptomyces griseoruber TaxID=1943 RepID=A0A117RDP9_9ACTN|nr:hypothetical protein AQJ64_13100 [Streptomyces griseoruber]
MRNVTPRSPGRPRLPALRPPPGRERRIECRYGGQELPGAGVARRLLHLVGGALLDDPAAAHHRDAVADLAYDGEVAGHEDQCEPEFTLEFAEQGDDPGPGGDVERGDGLDAFPPRAERVVEEPRPTQVTEREGEFETLTPARGRASANFPSMPT